MKVGAIFAYVLMFAFLAMLIAVLGSIAVRIVDDLFYSVDQPPLIERSCTELKSALEKDEGMPVRRQGRWFEQHFRHDTVFEHYLIRCSTLDPEIIQGVMK